MSMAKAHLATWATGLGKRYRQQLGSLSIMGLAWLVGALFLLPVLPLLGSHLVREVQTWQRAERAIDGSRVISDVLQAQAALLQVADLRLRARSGDSGLAGEQAAAAQAVRAAERQLEATRLATRDHARLPEWGAQSYRLAGLLGEALREGELRPAALAGLTRLPALAAEQSGLLLHRSGADADLAQARAHALGDWLAALSQLRGPGAVALAAGPPDAASRTAMLLHAETLARRLADVQVAMEGLTRAGEAPLAQWPPAAAASQRLLALTREQFGAAGDTYGGGAYAAEATAAAAAVLALDGEMHRLLQAQLAGQARAALWSLALAAGGSLLAWLALWGVMRTYVLGLRHVGTVLQHSLAAVAAGDLSREVPLRGQDALGGVAREVEHMSGRLSSLVAEIRSSAVRVSESGQAVAEDGQALAHRTELQAQSLSESVQVAERLSASVAAHAESAQTLNALTERLREQLDAGGQVVDQTEQSILSLQDSTRRVAEINQVIDDIAFQTNLLALNASVEAARAGEAGKGFAVVASEVRQLAQRCAGAAAEVRGLIDQTTVQVDEATTHIQATTALLSRVGGGVQEVARRLNVLATASSEQTSGLGDVRERFAALDSLTRENALAVARSTNAAQALAEQAEALQRAVSSVRLRQGTADEAQALVQRAVAHLAAVGTATAFEAFNAADGDWLDRDLYLFALDPSNRYVVAGGRPEWLGLSTFDLPGVTHAQAEAFLREAGLAVEAGGGWIEYTGSHPVSYAPVAKTAYIAPLPEGGFIGCGVHRHDVATADAAAASPVTAPDLAALAAG